MNPEEEEFSKADSVLDNADLPQLHFFSVEAVREIIGESRNNNELFRLEHEIMMIERFPLSADRYLFAMSHGVSRQDTKSGGVCWEGSHILALWLLSHFPETAFRGKVVLELGAGCTGLPGLALASIRHPQHVYLTESKTRLVETLRRNVELNFIIESTITVTKLDWDDSNDDESAEAHKNRGSIDVILGAELLWAGFDPCPLVRLIHRTLEPTSGVAYVLMPSGGRGAEGAFVQAVADACLELETVVLCAGWDRVDGSTKFSLSASSGQSDLTGDCSLYHIHVIRHRSRTLRC
jgi:hypothetical protein